MHTRLSVAVAVALTSFALHTATAQSAPPKAGPIQENAIFCDGRYALCTMAPCELIGGSEGPKTTAACACVVEEGYSMGPTDCSARQPTVKNGATHLVSTYSTKLNAFARTLSCSSDKQLWAWCYGSPCVVDPSDPKKAMCTCPVETGEMQTIGGNCDTGDGCGQLWSAATPIQNTFANIYYFGYMKFNHPTEPVVTPAAMCPVLKKRN